MIFPIVNWRPIFNSLEQASMQIGTGIVIRDHNGLCLAACRERSDNATLPELALAIRRAVAFAQEEGFFETR
jgi:hypothetical protein